MHYCCCFEHGKGRHSSSDWAQLKYWHSSERLVISLELYFTRKMSLLDDEDELLDAAIQLSIQESCKDIASLGSVEHQKILDAIFRGDLFALQELSDYPAAFTEVDSKGWYPIHRAAVQQSVQVLEMVLYGSYRLSLEEETTDGETPLILATQAGLVEIVRTLLENGASPNRINSKNESPLLLAVRTDSFEIAFTLISRGASVNQACPKNWTAIHEAAKVGCTDILTLLLQNGGNVLETDEHGVTPMGIAAEYGQAEALDILIHYGGDVNAQAPNGDSVLHDAASSGNPDCIELLLQHGANPNITNLSLQLPIHCAAYKGHYLALRMLIPVTTRRALRLSGQSPIHSAADGGHVRCMELLVDNGFDVNALLDTHVSDKYGDMRKTALYFAVSNGDVTGTQLLLNAGAKPDLDPLQCLLVAVRAGMYEIVRILLASRADVNCYFTEVNDTVFPTALQYCLRDEMMMRLLLNNGYDAEKCFCCPHDSSEHTNEKVPFCDFISVSWLVQFSGRAVRVLLDYVNHVPICSKLKMVLKRHKVWAEISEMLGNPHSLQHLCRLVIRREMTPQRLGNPKYINSGGFPPGLKSYLMYKEYDLYGRIMYQE
uniref:Ankyrin repeat and SOCS box containing 15a n=1 Tax=Cyprinus carpio TaxID=7962 RepID=A0A8C1UQA1_CYPCA